MIGIGAPPGPRPPGQRPPVRVVPIEQPLGLDLSGFLLPHGARWHTRTMAQTPNDKQPEPPRRGRVGEVSGDATLAARGAFVRAGFSDPTLVLRWSEIAGPDTARLARPLRLTDSPSGGVLTLKAEPAAALFLQHESRALCARINSYLGRVAVVRLKFVQGTLADAPPPPPRRPQPVEPAAADPVRRWQGPPNLGQALLNLARQRTRERTPD